MKQISTLYKFFLISYKPTNRKIETKLFYECTFELWYLKFPDEKKSNKMLGQKIMCLKSQIIKYATSL